MQRLIVTSATYRQSSKVTPALLEKDPENRLLARGPRFRLPAEMIRDTALAASGLLNDRDRRPERAARISRRASGKSWRSAKASPRRAYEQSHGKDLYRRSMYTFWKRTAPPASLATFDAPDREKCTARRGADEHAAAGAGAAERPDLRRGGARARRADAARGGHATTRAASRYAFRLATARKPTRQGERRAARAARGQRLRVTRRTRRRR